MQVMPWTFTTLKCSLGRSLDSVLRAQTLQRHLLETSLYLRGAGTVLRGCDKCCMWLDYVLEIMCVALCFGCNLLTSTACFLTLTSQDLFFLMLWTFTMFKLAHGRQLSSAQRVLFLQQPVFPALLCSLGVLFQVSRSSGSECSF